MRGSFLTPDCLTHLHPPPDSANGRNRGDLENFFARLFYAQPNDGNLSSISHPEKCHLEYSIYKNQSLCQNSNVVHSLGILPNYYLILRLLMTELCHTKRRHFVPRSP
jgi:hypothetical protein